MNVASSFISTEKITDINYYRDDIFVTLRTAYKEWLVWMRFNCLEHRAGSC